MRASCAFEWPSPTSRRISRSRRVSRGAARDPVAFARRSVRGAGWKIERSNACRIAAVMSSVDAVATTKTSAPAANAASICWRLRSGPSTTAFVEGDAWRACLTHPSDGSMSSADAATRRRSGRCFATRRAASPASLVRASTDTPARKSSALNLFATTGSCSYTTAVRVVRSPIERAALRIVGSFPVPCYASRRLCELSSTSTTGFSRVSVLRIRRRRNGRRHERLLDDAEHLLAPPLDHRLETAQVETRECDAADGAHRREPEIGEEVRGEHSPVDAEPLVRQLTLAVAVRERLDRRGTAVLRLADRGQEERLEDPRRRLVDDVRARDEDRVVRGRPSRQLVRKREELRRPVLHRPEDAAVAVVVHRPEGAEAELDLLHPAVLVDSPPPARLPPHALVAYGRRRLERELRQRSKPRRHDLRACRARG